MSHRRKKHRKHRLGLALPILCILLLAAILALAFHRNRLQVQQLQQLAEQAGAGQKTNTIRWNGVEYTRRERLETVLLIGIDDAGDGAALSYNNQYQADFLALLIFDKETGECRVLQLNRDTICSVPTISADGRPMGSQTEQLALAHTYGSGKIDSCRNVMTAVERLLYDAPVDWFVRLRTGSIGKLNDAVGGVTVTLREDFTAFDPEMAAGKTLTLNSEQAHTFVRARMGMQEPTNTARMERQREYLLAWADAAKAMMAQPSEKTAEERLVGLLRPVAGEIFSNMSGERMVELAERLLAVDSPEVLTIAGEAVPGEKYMEFYVDEEALQRQAIELFYTPVKGA